MKTFSILLVLLFLLVSIVVFLCIKARRKVRAFSMEAFGTPSLKEGFKQVEEEYVSTPKTVAGMTSLYLPQIKRDFPDFSYDEMKAKAENAITSYLLAVNGKDKELLQEGNSELKNKLANALSILNNTKEQEHFDNILLHRTEITNYVKRNGRCIITFQTSLEYVHYVTDASGAIVKGTDARKEQTRYEADLIYIQDRSIAENEVGGTIGLNCPNCGAPLTNFGAKTCPYCKTPVIELNIHAWSFSDVRQR